MSGGKITFGIIFILIGLILLVRSTGLFYIDFGDVIRLLLPFLFIWLGIRSIMKKKKQEDKIKYETYNAYSDQSYSQSKTQTDPGFAHKADFNPESFASEQAKQSQSTTYESFSTKASHAPERTGNNKLKYSKTLGDMFIDFKGLSLESVDISSGVGDLEVKFEGGKLSHGLNRVIISGSIGDMRLFIPKDIPHFVQCSNFIGDIDMNGRRSEGFNNSVEHHSEDYNSAVSKLYISVSGFIGDIRIFQV